MEWQIHTLQLLESIRVDSLTSFFQIITATAEGGFILISLVIIYWCIDKDMGLRLGFIIIFNTIINTMLKNIIRAPRPFDEGVVKPIRAHTATGYSFPSGHTQSATAFWLTLIRYLREKWIYCVGIIMIILVALSRLYLGVHWPVDTMGALFVGVTFTIVGELIIRKLSQVDNVYPLILCMLLTASILFISDSNYVKSIGALVGIIIGSLIERKYICYKVGGSLICQIRKIIVGFLVLIMFAIALKILLPSFFICDYIRYMILVLWIIVGAPYTFQKMKLEANGIY